MGVGEVVVGVRQRRVPMCVGVTAHDAVMVMQMVRVVLMFMRVFASFMRVLVPVPFRQVQPHAKRH